MIWVSLIHQLKADLRLPWRRNSTSRLHLQLVLGNSLLDGLPCRFWTGLATSQSHISPFLATNLFIYIYLLLFCFSGPTLTNMLLLPLKLLCPWLGPRYLLLELPFIATHLLLEFHLPSPHQLPPYIAVPLVFTYHKVSSDVSCTPSGLASWSLPSRSIQTTSSKWWVCSFSSSFYFKSV